MHGAASAAAAETVMSPVATLSSRVIRIMGLNPGPMTLQGSNTYLIGSGPERVLIDSGEGVPGYADLLRQAVSDESTRLGTPVRISTVLLTHWHKDHVGGVDTICQLFPRAQLFKRPSKYASTPVDRLCVDPPAAIEVEGATLRLLHTPGHTDDHVCAFLDEEQALFSGDTILGTGSTVFSCFKDYMDSLQQLLALQPRRLYSAHGPVVEEGAARIAETIQHRGMREEQVLHLLQSRAAPGSVSQASNLSCAGAEGADAMNIREIVEDIYTTTPASLKVAAGMNVFHHLKKLTSEGKVVVRHVPADLQAYLQDATDYTTFGEGASVDMTMIHRILSEFYVAAAPST